MGVYTTADEKLNDAKEHIRKASESLQEFLKPDTWGADSYKEDFKEEVEEALIQLLRIRRKIS